MLVRLCKRRAEYPSGAIVDMPADEALALIGFGLAESVADVDAETHRKPVERAKAPKRGRTATIEQTSVAQISQSEDSE
ncbi:MAG: hypothetical protein ACKN9R_03140 [Candidatus Limnocylindrus sp.]